MRVAYVHDWLVVDGGAEKVARSILNQFPEASVFSLIDFLSDHDREQILKGKRGTTSFIQKLPFAKDKYRSYLPLFPTAIRSLDLSGFDLIISSSYAVAKGVKVHSKQLHICYCHSPIRYAWDLRESYLKDAGLNKGLKGWLARKILDYIQQFDLKTVPGVNHFIANSSNVAERIQRIYNCESTVIHPTSEYKWLLSRY